MSSFIEFKDVKKIYKMGEVDITALAGVSFSIEKGEFVIVAGASGAGKSTILNILGGMDTLSSGEIIVDNNLISNYSEKELISYRRFDIGFVCKKYNMTVVIITHNLALTPMGDKVIKVKNGMIESVTLNDNPLPVERIEW